MKGVMIALCMMCYSCSIVDDASAVGVEANVQVVGKTTEQKQLVANFAKNVLALARKKLSPAEQEAQLSQMLSQYFNLEEMAVFCYGRYYQAICNDVGQQKAIDLFRRMVTRFCISLFKSCGSDSNAGFKVSRSRKVKATQGGVVSCQYWIDSVVSTQTKNYDIMWVLSGAESANSKIFDAKSEGISMKTALHDQLENVLSTSGAESPSKSIEKLLEREMAQ